VDADRVSTGRALEKAVDCMTDLENAIVELGEVSRAAKSALTDAASWFNHPSPRLERAEVLLRYALTDLANARESVDRARSEVMDVLDDE
jgi:hypothetical protein